MFKEETKGRANNNELVDEGKERDTSSLRQIPSLQHSWADFVSFFVARLLTFQLENAPGTHFHRLLKWKEGQYLVLWKR